jgi:DNA-binding transcriptional LysR family regulator
MAVLHAVLSEGSVARAAAKLHVTPSAVSNSLAKLREMLGDPLFTRKGRGIVPTPRAVALAPVLARAMEDLSRAIDARPFDAETCTSTFTLAVADVGQMTWVPRIVQAMRRELPLANLRVVGIDGLIALGDLGSSEIDVHLGVPSDAPGVHAKALVEERMVLVARAHHPVVRTIPSRARLAGLGHVAVDMVAGRNFRDPFERVFAKAGIARTIAVTVPSFTAAAEVVAESDLVTMLPSAFLETRPRLRPVRAPIAEHVMKLAMCWHERTHRDAANRAFRGLIARVVGGG